MFRIILTLNQETLFVHSLFLNELADKDENKIFLINPDLKILQIVILNLI